MGFREVDKVDDVLMLNGLPGLDFIFERVDEVLLRQRFIFRLVYLIDEALLLNHLASDHLVVFLGVYRQIGLREAAET